MFLNYLFYKKPTKNLYSTNITYAFGSPKICVPQEHPFFITMPSTAQDTRTLRRKNKEKAVPINVFPLQMVQAPAILCTFAVS